MLIDAFLYAGERDLLDLRYEELHSKVDYFMGVEGNVTFTGKDRTIDAMIIGQPVLLYTVHDFPIANNPWKREAWQRNSILKALEMMELPDDALIMVSDVDEIPRLSAIPETVAPGELYVFQQDTYHWNLNTKVISSNNQFPMGMCTRLCRYDDLKKWYPQGVRNMDGIPIPNGGWHLSWMGDAKAKAESYSHQELKQYGGTYAEQVQNRWDLKYEMVYGVDHLPQTIQNNIPLWWSYFIKPYENG